MILVFGRNGQLAKSLKELYKKDDIFFSSSGDLDLLNTKEIIPYIEKIQPSCIINCSAFNKVDEAEKNEASALKVNFEAVSEMSSYSFLNSIPIIHFSSDYVFDGNATSPYTEEDECNPINNYGKSKFLGERAVIDSNAKFLILRTSFLYSNTNICFPQIIKKLIDENTQIINGVTDMITSPTYSKNLADAVLQALPSFMQSNDSGVYHFSDSGSVSRFEFIQELISICKRNNPSLGEVGLFPVEDSFFQLPAKRPKFSTLDCKKILNDFNIPQQDWKSSLQNCFLK